jgi:hypothetical protein
VGVEVGFEYTGGGDIAEGAVTGAFLTPFGLRYRRLFVCLGAEVFLVPWPGLPGMQLTFFCFAKSKVSKRKGDPGSCVPPLRCGQPAVLGPAGSKTTRLRLKQVFALIRLALRSPAHPQGVGKEYRTAEGRRLLDWPYV